MVEHVSDVANDTTLEYVRAIKDVRSLLLKHDTRVISIVMLEFAGLMHSNLLGAGLISAEKIGESFDVAKSRAMVKPVKQPNVRHATLAELHGEAVATPSTETKQ